MEQILINNGYAKTRRVKYTTEFKNNNLFLYVVNEQDLSIVVSPDTNKEIISKYGGYLYHTSSLRKFPKRLNNGVSEIHYGYKINFNSLNSFQSFLTEYTI